MSAYSTKMDWPARPSVGLSDVERATGFTPAQTPGSSTSAIAGGFRSNIGSRRARSARSRSGRRAGGTRRGRENRCDACSPGRTHNTSYPPNQAQSRWLKSANTLRPIPINSRNVNPNLDAALIEQAPEDDPAAARAEWLAEFRNDIASFIER